MPAQTFVRCLALAFVGAATVEAQNGQWIQRAFATHPSSGGGTALVFDAARSQSLLQTLQGETWTYNGSAWLLRASNQGPPPGVRIGGGCFDTARQQVVVVVGDQSTGLSTWEWSGTAWSLGLVGGLPPRHSFSLAYDQARGQTLLFGGSQGGGGDYADLWTWDGAIWTQIYNGGPTQRWAAAMAYDAARQTVVLFGGEGRVAGQPRRLDDTWEWNGAHWQNHFGIVGPVARYFHAMSYDSRRQRVVLFGGATGQGQLLDTWEWDGIGWQQVIAPTALTATPSLAYDSNRGVTVAVSLSGAVGTFEYLAGSTQAATYSPFGVGCAGPAGVPQLAPVAGSLPRLGTTLQLQLFSLPTSLFSFAFGVVGFDATTWNGQPLPASLAPLGMPACSAWIAPAYSEALNNVGGTAGWNIVVPMNMFLVGVDLYFQGGVLAPAWNAAGAVLSNAGHARIGVM